MNLPSKTLAVALLAATSFAGAAAAVPLGAPRSQDAASPMVQTVQWRGGHRGWGGGWGGRGWGGVGAGLAAGAIIGGAVAASQPYGYGYDYSPVTTIMATPRAMLITAMRPGLCRNRARRRCGLLPAAFPVLRSGAPGPIWAMTDIAIPARNI